MLYFNLLCLCDDFFDSSGESNLKCLFLRYLAVLSLLLYPVFWCSSQSFASQDSLSSRSSASLQVKKASNSPLLSRKGELPIVVETAFAESIALDQVLESIGTLNAYQSLVIKAEVSGKIDGIHFSDGSFVRKDGLLVSLDSSTQRVLLEQAQAEVVFCRKKYHRLADLAARKFISENNKDQAWSELRVAEGKLSLAKVNLEKMLVHAPFSGILGFKNISVGMYVEPGRDLIVLQDISRVKVDLPFPERYFGQLRVGQEISLRFDAYPQKNFSATVRAIDVEIDQGSRSFWIRSILKNPNGLLRAGMLAKANVRIARDPDTVVVPEESLITTNGDSFSLYRVQDSFATRVNVQVGMRKDGKVEIVSGLKTGEQVITAGQAKFLGRLDKIPVRVISPVIRE